MVIGDIFHPLLKPLLSLQPALAILIISVTTSLIVTILQKYVTNQEVIKNSKERQKKIRQEIQKHKNDPEKMMKLNKESMEASLPMFKETFKVTAITMIPFFLIFAWLSAHFAYYPLNPNEAFSITADVKNQETAILEILPQEKVQILTAVNKSIVDKKATWNLSGEAGEYTLRITAGNSMVERDLIIGDVYSTQKSAHSSDISRITIGNKSRKVDVFGFQMHWLVAYIIFSLATTISARKLLNVH